MTNPENGAGFAPGTALGSRRAGERSVAAPVIARLGYDSHSSLNITRHVLVPFVPGGRSWRLRSVARGPLSVKQSGNLLGIRRAIVACGREASEDRARQHCRKGRAGGLRRGREYPKASVGKIAAPGQRQSLQYITRDALYRLNTSDGRCMNFTHPFVRVEFDGGTRLFCSPFGRGLS